MKWFVFFTTHFVPCITNINQRTEGPASCQEKFLADALLNEAYMSKEKFCNNLTKGSRFWADMRHATLSWFERTMHSCSAHEDDVTYTRSRSLPIRLRSHLEGDKQQYTMSDVKSKIFVNASKITCIYKSCIKQLKYVRSNIAGHVSLTLTLMKWL